MAKTLDDSVLDASLNIIKGATQLCLCSAQPTTYTEATVTYMLVLKTGLTAGSYTGPADGTVNGRKITKNLENAISVTNSGTVLFAALCSASVLLAVTTVTSQVVTAGNTVNCPAFSFSLSDPT
jgi:hypothetical protein